MGSGFPPTSGKIPPTSGSSDLDPHEAGCLPTSQNRVPGK